ncbi:hypothetical protein [Nonomuraea rhodomycinica]|uniref:Uncharacterized protein n=1 Tax=Nonomuraea rhodomycinica TaxID=1712872 RepID=A0A7Y6ISE7_9ACTN|nr:hypothetical protein [Nonomuraea rhodomycinica]NUW43300.1 hypothetical protein [Nonomuraea rhodomycinica]
MREVEITSVRLLGEPLPMSQLHDNVPPFVQRYLNSAVCLPDKAGQTLTSVLFLLRPALKDIVTELEEPDKPVQVRGPVGRALVQVRDAVGNALQMAGFGKELLGEWSPPVDLEVSREGFLSQLPEGRAREDPLIIRDAERFVGWLREESPDVEWRAFRRGGQRLIIGNCNRQADETAMGVDLIYFHETRRSFVLVQYKRLERADGDWSYYPSRDRSLDRELDRMRAVDATCANVREGDDYRLNSGPCWIKLCRSETTIPRTDELVQGMYLTRAYFERLRNSSGVLDGSRKGIRFGYKTVPRYLDNTTFGQLVADGWIGSSGTGSDLIERQIKASREGKREIVFAAVTGEDKKRAERTQERRQGMLL